MFSEKQTSCLGSEHKLFLVLMLPCVPSARTLRLDTVFFLEGSPVHMLCSHVEGPSSVSYEGAKKVEGFTGCPLAPHSSVRSVLWERICSRKEDPLGLLLQKNMRVREEGEHMKKLINFQITSTNTYLPSPE